MKTVSWFPLLWSSGQFGSSPTSSRRVPLGPALGRYFHVLDALGRIQQQGKIIRRRCGGWFVVECYAPLYGEIDSVHQEIMQPPSWTFYNFESESRGVIARQQEKDGIVHVVGATGRLR